MDASYEKDHQVGSPNKYISRRVFKNLDRQGSALLQILIVSGIAGVILFSMMATIENMIGVQATLETSAELYDRLSSVRAALSHEKACDENISFFQNVSLEKQPKFRHSSGASEIMRVLSLRIGSTDILMEDGQSLTNRPGSLVKISMTNFRNINGPYYLADLQFQLQRKVSGTKVFGPNTILRKIPIHLETTADGDLRTIIHCSHSSTMLSTEEIKNIKREMCISLSGDFNEVSGMCDIGPYYQP